MKTFNNIISKEILKQSLNNLYSSGLPYGLTTNTTNLDNIMRIDKGKLVTITGIPNMGKSEFLDYLCVQYNKLHGLKTVYFSPENQPLELHLSKLVSKYTNKQFSKNNINENELNNTLNHISNNYYFLNYENVFNLDVVLEETEKLINTDGNIGILVIDSYNKLEAQKEFSVTETDYISKILDTLERFAKRMNIIVCLVAHPRKMQKDVSGVYVIPSPYDINGSANFFNKSDYCITVHRDYINNNTIIKVDKVKFKNYGSVGETRLGYDINSGNYYDIDATLLDFDTFKVSDEFKPDNFIIPEFKEENKTTTLMNTEINYFNSISDTLPKKCTLNEMLLTNKFDDQKNKVDIVRNEKDKDRKKVHKGCLLNYTVSCTFDNKRDSKDVKEINPLICIDIDKQDNEQIISQVPDILKSIDNVLYYSKSCSGEGYFCIIPISNKNKFGEHWNSLNEDFKKVGITIDKQCKDITRVRYFSYDDNYYYNPNAAIYSRFKELSNEKDKTGNNRKNNLFNDNKISESDQKKKDNDIYIRLNNILKESKENGYNITDSYNNWFTVAMSLINEYNDNGRDLFHSFSKLSDKYNEDETNTFFDELLDKYENDNEITINSLFHLFNEIKKQLS